MLFVTDIHEDFNSTARLCRWLQQCDRVFDAVLVGGDLNTLSYDEADDEAAQDSAMRKFRRIVSAIAQCAPGARIFFVPGNHDPVSLFGPNNTSGDGALDFACDNGQRARNLHGRHAELAPCLHIVGFGGSSPAFEGVYGSGAPVADGTDGTNGTDGVGDARDTLLGTRVVWQGFPLSESQVAAGMQGTWERWCAAAGLRGGCADNEIGNNGHDGTTAILLVHCGPSCVGTTEMACADPNDPSHGPRPRLVQSASAESGVSPRDVIRSGSSASLQFACRRDVQRVVPLMLHGHTHAADGTSRVGAMQVLNPGSLRYGGRFGTIRVNRAARGWSVSELGLHTLDGAEAALRVRAPARPTSTLVGSWLAAATMGALCASVFRVQLF